MCYVGNGGVIRKFRRRGRVFLYGPPDTVYFYFAKIWVSFRGHGDTLYFYYANIRVSFRANVGYGIGVYVYSVGVYALSFRPGV